MKVWCWDNLCVGCDKYAFLCDWFLPWLMKIGLRFLKSWHSLTEIYLTPCCTRSLNNVTVVFHQRTQRIQNDRHEIIKNSDKTFVIFQKLCWLQLCNVWYLTSFILCWLVSYASRILFMFTKLYGGTFVQIKLVRFWFPKKTLKRTI